ncbi:MAG TPA: GrpB family protein [Ideonella sp.]|uniref:GrpB family protein n=1 Tax=Ideonella sp. TaxID=1929293 RepID=UPI002C265B6F|nr:GrpB family protein [Ideonella sp.]HSI50250.1 GrpB family protein [Ideonella sp.]
MTEDESLLAAIHEEVRLQPYEPSWPEKFLAEMNRLASLLPGVFSEIAHVGSTAIPGMPAKPIIDVLAGVASMALAKSLAVRICAAGYGTSAEFNDSLADRQWFMRWSQGHRTHHLHVVVHGGDVWRDHLAFRDALRASSELAARYAELKFRLAARHAIDREAYTEAKAEFIRAALRNA